MIILLNCYNQHLKQASFHHHHNHHHHHRHHYFNFLLYLLPMNLQFLPTLNFLHCQFLPILTILQISYFIKIHSLIQKDFIFEVLVVRTTYLQNYFKMEQNLIITNSLHFQKLIYSIKYIFNQRIIKGLYLKHYCELLISQMNFW